MSFSELSVGSRLPKLQIEPITRKTLALFAGASGDHQPTHIDVDAARLKGRDDVIAHGMLVMAYMGRLLTDLVPQEKLRSFSARFVAITPVRAEPVFEATVTAIKDGLATLALEARLSDGKLVAKGEAVIEIA